MCTCAFPFSHVKEGSPEGIESFSFNRGQRSVYTYTFCAFYTFCSISCFILSSLATLSSSLRTIIFTISVCFNSYHRIFLCSSTFIGAFGVFKNQNTKAQNTEWVRVRDRARGEDTQNARGEK